jgi:hypothetical protein
MTHKYETASAVPPGSLEALDPAEIELSVNQRDSAIYIAEMCLGLRTLARRAGLNFLAYLLEMVVAESIERGGGPRRPVERAGASGAQADRQVQAPEAR